MCSIKSKNLRRTNSVAQSDLSVSFLKEKKTVEKSEVETKAVSITSLTLREREVKAKVKVR